MGGKANCAGKGTPVKDEKGCKAAAKALKKQFGGSSTAYTKYPKGCFMAAGKLYYNKGKTGAGNKAAQAVCVATASATKKPTGKKLVFAGSAKTNCAGKGTPVKDEKACQAAAKAMKRQYGGSSATKYVTFPKGCFGYNGKFYYNKGKTGKGKAGASPVCVQVTGGATKKPTGKKLIFAGGNKANCAGKGTPVKDIKGCQAAAKALKRPFGGASATKYSQFPKGCFGFNKRLYYNTGKTGKGNAKASPVCVAKASATKKPTKKLVLAAKGKVNCVGKGTPVQGFNGCKAAAKAIKKTFIAKVSRSAALPKGCLVVNNKVQYNALNGKANKNAQPVCVQVTGGKKTTPKKGGGKKTTPKKKPTKKLVMAAKGKANCAGKGTPVKDIKGCQAAAKALKKQFGSSSMGYTAYPKGCFMAA